MTMILKLLKYEFLNIIRSRWVFFYTLFLFLLSSVFLYLAGSSAKALVTISSVMTVLVPLTCILFTSFYWYNSDRLTELLLTQPLSRGVIVLSRFLAMSLSLGLGFLIGVVIPFIFRGEISLNLLWVSFFGGFLAITFCALGLMIGVFVADKMRGVGLAFAIWFYFILAHDLVVMVILILAKEYPMDFVATLLAAVNPIGLTRVILLVIQDASMLLGHSGALVREILIGVKGVMMASVIIGFWLFVPIYFAYRTFLKRDL